MSKFLLLLVFLFNLNHLVADNHQGLNRDYVLYDEWEGILYFEDLIMLDDNDDYSYVFYASYCPKHFARGYYADNWDISPYMPALDYAQLFLIPQFGYPWCNTFEKHSAPICSCGRAGNYPGYLDVDFHKYNAFLEEQVKHYCENPTCTCYWPEISVEAGILNNHAYLLFQDLIQNTTLNKLVNREREQSLLLKNVYWDLNLHGLSVSCVARSFWFSHYYRVGLNILNYANYKFQAGEISSVELDRIFEYVHSILATLANEFMKTYQLCLSDHPSPAIKNELHFLNSFCHFSDDLNLSTQHSVFENNKQLTQMQAAFETTHPIENRVLGSPVDIPAIEPILDGDQFNDPLNFFGEYYLYQGLYLNDVLQFHEAIKKFDLSLKYDSKNKLTYLARAYANFELMNFEQAIADYATAKEFEIIPPLIPCTVDHPDCGLAPSNRIEFTKGYVLGFMEGFNQGTHHFVPSVLHTVTGIGQGLWGFAKHPVILSKEFTQVVGIYVSLLKEIDLENLDACIPEINDMLGKWDALTDFDKGRKIGFVIGKFGIDILFTTESIKLIRSFRELKYANGSLTLEGLVAYQERKVILEEAEKRSKFRFTLFKNGKVKIHWGLQNKHMPGHTHYEPGRSPIKISKKKLEELCSKKIGTGEAVYKQMGEAGYKERVDFGEIIGDCIYKNEREVIVQKPTTIGIIHYKANGYFHVIPGRPKL